MTQDDSAPSSPWLTAKELAELTPEQPEYIVEDLWVRGAITLLNAKIKTGKTTFVGSAIAAVLLGDDIIGKATMSGPICWLTEEGTDSFGAVLLRSRLEAAEQLHILPLSSIPRSIEWADVVTTYVIPKMEELGAIGLVVDTLSRWAKFKGDEENDSGAAATAMAPLEAIRDGPLHAGIFIVHHDSKGMGRSVQDSGRGSSALGGAADILLNLSETDDNSSRRTINGISRWKSIKIGMEWDEIGRRYIGAEADSTGHVERGLAKQLALNALSTYPMSIDEIGLILPQVKRTTLGRALKDLVAAGSAMQAGAGTRGAPIRFSLNT